jgi:hypothetical protein
MTLLDAPAYNAARARKRRRNILASLIGVIIIAIFVWVFWNWPAERPPLLCRTGAAALRAGLRHLEQGPRLAAAPR